MDTLIHDLRHAVRALLRQPGLALAAVLSLGLGVGANTIIFSWIEEFVLRAVPLARDAERLVLVQPLLLDGQKVGASYPAYLDWRASTRTLSDLAAYDIYQFGLRTTPPGTGGTTEPLWGNFATANYFSTLGVRPAVGRFFRAEEGETKGGAPVAVISHGLWQRAFAGDSSVVGRRVWVNGRELTVVGVAPRSFAGAFVGLGFDLWVPMTMYPLLGDYPEKLDARGSGWLEVFGRLKPGVTVAQAGAELQAVGRGASEASDGRRAPGGAVAAPRLRVAPFDRGELTAMLRPLLGALLGVTAVIMLVVCANVANLLLARAAARARETALRAALGAQRSRLVRQLLTESLVLAAGGGLLGVLVAWWGTGLLHRLLPPTNLPVTVEAPIDGRVLAFGVLLSLATTLLFGTAPALRASRPDLTAAVKLGAPGAVGGRQRLLRALVAAQVALSLVSLVSAGLFLHTLAELRRMDTGLRDPEHVMLLSTDLGLAGRTADGAGLATIARIVDRARALPGVAGASVADAVPLGFGGWNTDDVSVPGYVPRDGERMTFLTMQVGDGYFATMGIPLLDGRPIRTGDRTGAPAVFVVNEAFVRSFWPDGGAVGRRVRVGGREGTVVGVARDGRYQIEDFTRGVPPVVYAPLAQGGNRALTLHVRTVGDPAAVLPPLRRAFAAEDPSLPVFSPMTLAEYSTGALFVQRLGATVLGALGAFALLLVAVGLYGVMAYAVALRTREVGLRMALGAERRVVLRSVVGDGLRLACVGVAAGAVLAVAAARLLRSQLVGVGAADPVAFGGAIALLAAVAILASYVPARRAARVDPMEALRSE